MSPSAHRPGQGDAARPRSRRRQGDARSADRRADGWAEPACNPGRHPRPAESIREPNTACRYRSQNAPRIETRCSARAACRGRWRTVDTVDRETFVRLSREFSDLEPIVEAVNSYRATAAELNGIDAMLADAGTDAEMRALAEDERPALAETLARSNNSFASRSCPRMRRTNATSFSKFAPAPAATRRPCSPATSSACTSAMPPSRAGRSR